MDARSNILTEPQSDAFYDILIDKASKYDQFSEAEAIEFGREVHIELGGEEEDYNPKYTIEIFNEMVRKGLGLIKQLAAKTYIWK